MDIRYLPHISEEGTVLGIVAVVRDLTEHMAARKTIDQLSTAIDQAIDGVAIGDAEHKLTYVNPAFAAMHGFRPEEMIGMRVADLHDEEQLEAYHQEMHQIKTQGFWSGKFDHLKKDGTLFPTQMSVSVLRDDKGRLESILAICRDITIQKRLQNQLIENEEVLRTIFDTVQVGIVITTLKEGRVKKANHSFADMLGYELEEIIGKTSSEPAFWKNLDKHQEIIAILESDRPVLEHEIDFFTKTGEARKGSISVERAFFSDQECLITALRDITQAKKDTALLDNFLHHSSDMISIAGTDGLFQYLNPAWEKNLGYSREFLSSHPFLEFIHPEDQAKTLEELSKLASGQSTHGFQNRYLHKNGSPHYLEWNATPDEDGLLYCIARDITEKKKIERAMDKFFEQPMNLHIIAGFDGYIHRVNIGWQEALGYTQDEIQGTSIYEYVHPEDLSKTTQEMQHLGKGMHTFYFENRHQHKNGEYRFFAWSAITEPEDQLIYAVASDITEQKQAEKEKEKQQMLSIHADRLLSLGEMSAGMAHELNQPLQGIRGSSEHLLIGLDKGWDFPNKRIKEKLN